MKFLFPFYQQRSGRGQQEVSASTVGYTRNCLPTSLLLRYVNNLEQFEYKGDIPYTYRTADQYR